MAVYDLEEQEQLAEIKAWWRQHGNRVTSVLLAAALVALGWQGWNWYQNKQTAQASYVFTVLEKALEERNGQQIKAAGGELLEKFGGTAYAPLGALMMAKAAVEEGDLKTAKLQLNWVVDHGKGEIQDIGRLRLATLLLDDKAADQAMKLLETKPSPAFTARYADARGDALLAQGKQGEAKAAYKEALAALDAADKANKEQGGQEARMNAPYKQILQQKIDSLGDA